MTIDQMKTYFQSRELGVQGAVGEYAILVPLVEQEGKLCLLFETRAETLVRALLSGPESKDLTSAIPEGFDVRSIRVEDGECFVNLASSMLSALPADADLRQAINALSKSLVSLETVDGVRLLVDGELVGTAGGTLESRLFAG